MSGNRSEIVISCSNGEIYHSLAQAARATKSHLPSLCEARTGQDAWQYGGYSWQVLGRRFLLIRTDTKTNSRTAYNSIREAAIANHVCMERIQTWIQKGKSFYGYSWQWEEQDYSQERRTA